MIFKIPQLLTINEVRLIRNSLEKTTFTDGGHSVGEMSTKVKNNLQSQSSDASQKNGRRIIVDAVERNEMLKYFVLPKHIMAPLFNCYREGMYYGNHIDEPILGEEIKIRGDVSLTIFLTDPNTYDGGELVINLDGREQVIKLKQGEAICYPSTLVHRVNKVTRGTRISAVTTIQSRVRSAEQRNVLIDMAKVLRWSQDNAPNARETILVHKAYTNLIRMWAD